ncbi:hypothetical protein MO973_01150 [Paenibacillus sp. TRM 82003]|nr:hypothetical protein [Paenibacillus sp. TRM 82003]
MDFNMVTAIVQVVSLLLSGLVLFALVSAVVYMYKRMKSDKETARKLDEIIALLREDKRG